MPEKFNTRDVSKKEIYDSYMGILRISPNEINGTEVDDATILLNTLYDEDKKDRTKITLSDSDGNWLPITFQPRAFQTNVTRRDTTTGIDKSNIPYDVLHIATLIGKNGGSEGKGFLYVSDSLKCRSTLFLTRSDYELENDYRHSNLIILSGGKVSSDKKIQGDGILLYPTESPNDDNYFNNKNEFDLFNPESSIPRHEQVEQNLLKWTREEHNKIPVTERVHAGYKSVTQINEYNEEVPLYYTRDYILGHYDGHACKTDDNNNSIFDSWGVTGNNKEKITKLSWTRFDKLIWDSLDEILTGNIRHIKGRYDELGVNESSDPGIREKIGLESGIEYKDYAPILGTEMPRGIITYHAMPFHRYWFHRTRQALRAFIERRKGDASISLSNYDKESGISMDEWIIKTHSLNDGNYQIGNFQAEEISKLEEFYNLGILSPTTNATIGFTNSLGKNFILCNGCNVNFQNFPNISLTNEYIFDTTQKSEGNTLTQNGVNVAGGVANYDSTNGFVHNEVSSSNNVYTMIYNSMGNSLKLPNLFALYEKSPRFIRGLNWENNTDDSIVNVFDKNTPLNNKSNYVDGTEGNSVGQHTVEINVKEQLDDNGQNVEKEYQVRVKKNLTNVSKVYFHTYDHLVEKETHQHHLFSSIEGDTSGYNNSNVHMIHCSNTRGTHEKHKNDWRYSNFNSYDRLYNKSSLLAENGSSTTWCFNSSDWAEEAKDKNTWFKYCGGQVYSGTFYYNYNPIPTCGLFLFNASLFNNKDLSSEINNDLSTEIIGVTNNYMGKERGTALYNGFYISPPEEPVYTGSAKNRLKQRQLYLKELEDWEANGTENYVENDIEGEHYSNQSSNEQPPSYDLFYIDAEGIEHYLKNEAPISIDTKNNSTVTTDELKHHDQEKQRRKFFAMKMNEAEGFIPISFVGKASGKVEIAWSRDERSGSKPASRNTYHDIKKNIASYKMGVPKEYDHDKSYWRCVTSIPYINADKLGVGDVKNYISNRKDYNENTDYYDVNCVTQLSKDTKYKTYNFGKVPVKVDETCPNPPYVNLLPLIRI